MRSLDRLLDHLGRRADAFFEELDRQIAETFDDDFGIGGFSVSPVRYAVHKGENKVIITVEVPGMTKNDVEVALEAAILTVRGRKQVTPGHVISVEKRFKVNPKTDVSDILATVKDGLLTITVQRDTQPAPPKGKIPVS